MDVDQIPAVMVEVAARALADETHGSKWWTSEWTTVADRNILYARARVTLAAALGVCEVREEWAHRSHWPDGTEHDMWGLVDGSRWAAEQLVAAAPVATPRTLIRRLVITTPAQPVTEGDTDGTA